MATTCWIPARSSAQLDLTIAIDSSMIHLAGALQFPVWMMSRHDQCWRWEWSGRTDSDWYPTLRIFQQREAGDWADVVRRVSEKLEATLAVPVTYAVSYGTSPEGPWSTPVSVASTNYTMTDLPVGDYYVLLTAEDAAIGLISPPFMFGPISVTGDIDPFDFEFSNDFS